MKPMHHFIKAVTNTYTFLCFHHENRVVVDRRMIAKLLNLWANGGVSFTSFSTIFQSYLDDGKVTMKNVCSGTPIPV